MSSNTTNIQKLRMRDPNEVQTLYTLRCTSVFIRTSFIGFHRWVDAPPHVEYLRDYHRHVFGIRVGVSVFGKMNREIEFITLKEEINAFLQTELANRRFEFSCEQIGELIVDHLVGKGHRPTFVEVNEDEENGSFSVVRYYGPKGSDMTDGYDVQFGVKEVPEETLLTKKDD